MEHEMILLCADYRTVCARMTARRKHNAGMADSERLLRTEEYAGENPAASSTSEEHEDSKL